MIKNFKGRVQLTQKPTQPKKSFAKYCIAWGLKPSVTEWEKKNIKLILYFFFLILQ